MNFKRIMTMVLVLALLVAGVATVAAQERPSIERGAGVARAMVEALAAELDMTPPELARQLRDGATVADLIAESGKTLDEVAAVVTAAGTDAINEGVANGTIPQQRADFMLENIDELVERALNGDLREQFGDRRGGRGPRGDLARDSEVVQAITGATGLTPQEILAAMEDGSTLADVVEANGGDVAALQAEVTDVAQARIDDALANGRISQEQADRLSENLPSIIDELFNTSFDGSRIREFRGQRGSF